MKLMLTFLVMVLSLSSFAATCDADEFLNTTEGQDKIKSLLERSKSLMLSKLEDLGFEERQVLIKSHQPKKLSDADASLSIQIASKGMEVDGSRFLLSKTIQEEDCGLEIKILGGRLINKESGKDFGSLGLVKEFIRLN
jgi:hypothetical protein